MLQIRCGRWIRLAACLGLIVLTLPSSGCVAAAITACAVGGGAATYAYVKGEEERDIPAGFDQTWAASQKALKDLGMPVLSAERDHDGGTIISKTGTGDKVKITLEPRAAAIPADGQWTTIGVRVAWFGDSPTSDRILNQIETELGIVHAPPPQLQMVPATVQGPPGQWQVTPQVPSPTGPPPLAPRPQPQPP